MNNILALVVVCMSMLPIQTMAQEETIKGLKIGFKKGDYREFSRYLNEKTEVGFEGEKMSYKKADAEKILADFFSKNVPTDFQVLHQGSSKEGLKFIIGELKHAKGTYRVLVYLKGVSNSYLIDTIDISKE